MYKYLVTYNDRTIKISVSDKTEVVSNAIQAFKSKMPVSNNSTAILSMYDEDFKSYYEINPEDLPNIGKLELSFKNDIINNSISETETENANKSYLNDQSLDNESDTSSSNVNTDVAPPTNIVKTRCDASSTSSSKMNSHSGPSASSQSSTSSQSIASSSRSVDVVTNSWPAVFNIDESRMTYLLKKTLHSEAILDNHLSSFLTCIYEQITSYKMYPRSAEYREVATAIVRKYPYLGGQLPFGDSLDLWVSMLTQKARNMRRRGDKSDPKVLERKKQSSKKRSIQELEGDDREPHEGDDQEPHEGDDQEPHEGDDQEPHETPNRNNRKKLYPDLAWGVKNFLPKQMAGEDSASVQRHITTMRTDSTKKKTNKLLAEDLLKRTFSYRRSIIVEQNAQIASLKEEFPLLFVENQIQAEYFRLTEVDISAALSQRFEPYVTAILTLAKFTSHDEEDDDNTELGRACRAMSLLPSLLREKPFGIVDEKVLSPNLRLADSASNVSESASVFVVFAEKIKICEAEGLLQAMAMLFATCYIFHCNYGEMHKLNLTFCQKAILGITDSIKTPVSVIKLLKKLNDLKSRI